MKINRLISILMTLINKKKVTAKQLAEYHEVSVRTIQRDMDTLSAAGIPLYADVGVHGGYQLLDNYKLEKGFLNKNEASILFSFLKSLEDTTPYPEVKSIYNKFNSLSDSSLDNSKLIIKLNPNHNSDLFKRHLESISQARDLKKKLKIIYHNVNFEETTRIICPHSVVMYLSAWYVYAYCELRNDFRMFKIHRIVSTEIMHEGFLVKDFPSKLPWDTILEIDRASTEIILEIDKKLQGRLPDYFEPSNCNILEDKIIVTIDFPIDEWVYSLLMGLVPYVKIIKPNYLRKEFTHRLKKALDLNNYDI